MLKKGLFRFLRGDRGATAIEYALIAVFIGAALIASMPYLKDSLAELFMGLSNALSNSA